ncbi:PucR family transcriptional regulator [Sphaerisporangium perillae]|uniref:PucR family transcriptional regulator n=1 Tax=Sphaerisporangium perillae TaxID=2935860 RepID=UPI00200F8100|nr:PucR family transcriptional regulator [Sphaerisporangium perillae]
MRIRDLLAIEGLRLTLLSGEDHLDRRFTGAHITDLPDPGRYLSGGELVLTGLMWRHGPEDSRRFVEILAKAKVAALGAGRAWLGHVPDDLVEACREHDLPLLDVPVEVSFRTLSEVVEARLGRNRVVDLRGALGRHRRIVAAIAEGTGLDDLFAIIAQELGITGAVVSASGAVVAGRLQGDLPALLAREFLAATRLPHLVRTPQGPFTLFAVDRSHRAAGWALALGSDLLDHADTGFELAACVALSRSRTEEGRRVERRLAEELIGLACSGAADTAELASRLRTCGIGTEEPYAVVTAAVLRPGAMEGPDLATLGGQMLEELLDRRVVAARGADGAVALVPRHVVEAIGAGSTAGEEPGDAVEIDGSGGGPVSDPGGEKAAESRADGRADREHERRVRTAAESMHIHPQVRAQVHGQMNGHVQALVHTLRERVTALSAGMPRAQVAIGVSAWLTGASGIRGGAEEAGHARRLAETRGGGVVTSDEIYTHALLLATVPAEVRRSFSDRILVPLFAYDQRHRSELVRTLDVFLECAGSWHTCAERLHVHVNTVRYRIRRVEELTGRDLGSMADRVDLFLALRAN